MGNGDHDQCIKHPYAWDLLISLIIFMTLGTAILISILTMKLSDLFNEGIKHSPAYFQGFVLFMFHILPSNSLYIHRQ
jgi:prepilin signal peptidase PulO-like enzyme (type II secretory pathway)